MEELMNLLYAITDWYDKLVKYSQLAEEARENLNNYIKELKDTYKIDLYAVERKGKK